MRTSLAKRIFSHFTDQKMELSMAIAPTKLGLSLLVATLFVGVSTIAANGTRDLNAQGVSRGADGSGGGGSYRDRKTRELKPIGEVEEIFNRTYELGSKSYAPYYDIPEAAQQELRKILAQVPYLPWRCYGNTEPCTLGKPRGTFIDHRNIDPVEYGKIKADYRKVIQSFGKTFDDEAFVLAAYSKGDETYILKAFEDHSAQRQAMLLIHEANMRYAGPTTEGLKKVLELDSAIWNFLRKGRSEESEWRLMNALVRLGRRTPSELRGFKLDALSKKLGRPLLLSELITDPSVLSSLDPILPYDHLAAPFDPRIVQMFNPQSPGITEYLKSCSLKEAERLYGSGYSPEFDWQFYKILQDPAYVATDDFRKSDRGNWMEAYRLNLETARSLNQICTQNYELLKKARLNFKDDKFVVPFGFTNLALVSCKEALYLTEMQKVLTGNTTPVVILNSVQWSSVECRAEQ